MAALGKFSSGPSDDLVSACLRLAMIYRCDPAAMLSKSPGYIAALNSRTPEILEDMIEANLYGR